MKRVSSPTALKPTYGQQIEKSECEKMFSPLTICGVINKLIGMWQPFAFYWFMVSNEVRSLRMFGKLKILKAAAFSSVVHFNLDRVSFTYLKSNNPDLHYA